MTRPFECLQFGACEVCGLAQLPDQLSFLMVPLDAKGLRFFSLFYCADNPECHRQAMEKLTEIENRKQRPHSTVITEP